VHRHARIELHGLGEARRVEDAPGELVAILLRLGRQGVGIGSGHVGHDQLHHADHREATSVSGTESSTFWSPLALISTRVTPVFRDLEVVGGRLAADPVGGATGDDDAVRAPRGVTFRSTLRSSG
jgi:hypothetical protein